MLPQGLQMPSHIMALSCWPPSCSKQITPVGVSIGSCTWLNFKPSPHVVLNSDKRGDRTVPLIRLIATVAAKIEPNCSLECKYLTSDDYKDLLWTTLAEFPGEMCPLGSFSCDCVLCNCCCQNVVGDRKLVNLGCELFSSFYTMIYKRELEQSLSHGASVRVSYLAFSNQVTTCVRFWVWQSGFDTQCLCVFTFSNAVKWY